MHVSDNFTWLACFVAIISCQGNLPRPCCLETKQLRVFPLSPDTSSTKDTQSTYTAEEEREREREGERNWINYSSPHVSTHTQMAMDLPWSAPYRCVCLADFCAHLHQSWVQNCRFLHIQQLGGYHNLLSAACVVGVYQIFPVDIPIWLVVFRLPLWKIWVRQLGWWNTQHMEK